MTFDEGVMFAVKNMTSGSSVLKPMNPLLSCTDTGTGGSNHNSDESVC